MTSRIAPMVRLAADEERKRDSGGLRGRKYDGESGDRDRRGATDSRLGEADQNGGEPVAALGVRDRRAVPCLMQRQAAREPERL
jgi:hypothetical protein